MSLIFSKRVWLYSRSRGVARLVLLALADFADDRGNCYPGQARLAKMCNTTVRSVFEALKKLQALNEVMVLSYAGRYGTHAYIITLPEETSAVEETSGGQGAEESSTGHEGDRGRPEVYDGETGSSCTSIGSLRQTDRKTSSDNPSENHQRTISEPPDALALASPQGVEESSDRSEGPVPMPDEVRERLAGSRYGQEILKLAGRQTGKPLATVQTPAPVNS